ncbi:uncharacterized protein A4U43_C04F11970 [Asparagus officinalis]|uniref:Plastid lipid-associated protein/fibrillin conserved domain-containing protein n=1 Tax=Asparagus officinalis TaxID=4686 RepID=A0A5P1F4N5_ASPOF|nr:probable plastid-lipid-associated protein 3, chloroplastic [Asparagus officinalis]ONK71749.1 uncharacterized protein A4U43_C04F11970 [Asparagus officinalis]
MAALVSSSIPSLFSLNPRNHKSKPLHFFFLNPNPNLNNPHRLSFTPRNPSSSPLTILTPRKLRANTDEWGEKSDPEPEPASKPDPPKEDDEWDKDSSPSAKITDKWGEKSDPDPEAASEPDPPRDEDEWGKEASSGSEPEPEPEPVPEPESDKLGDLKRCLVDNLYGTEYGLRASAEVRAEIFELVSQLEAENPTPAPNETAEFLDGNWILLYTAFSELLPLVAIGTIPLLKIKEISQQIDTRSMSIINATTLSSPFATFSFSATASFEVRSPSRIQVRFKEGAFKPPEISSTVNLPENIEVFGQKISLSPVQQSLNPLQEAVANIARSISGQPPLKIPIPGDRTASWLLTTYLDADFRISRGDGGLFVLAKKGSPLLDQLS